MPTLSIEMEGWSRPLGGGTQKEDICEKQMSFFLEQAMGVENMMDISQIAKEARKRGMTYGQFVAMGRCV